jgi:hypothetical protein
MEPITEVAEVVEDPSAAGMPYEQMDALMNDMLGGRETSVGKTGDSLTTMAGGHRFIQGIYWAKPPKLGKQQMILVTMREAEEEPDVVKQTQMLCNLAMKLLSVRDDTEFRSATEAEIKDDDTGLTLEEIRDLVYRLMNMSQSAEGNA